MKSQNRLTRRQLTLGGAALSAGAAARRSSAQRTTDSIRLAFIGIGNRGSQLLTAALPNKDIEIVAFCDIYKPYLDRASARAPKAKTETDFRKVIDRKDVDAVVIATPDHWHAIQAIAACDAGKDVYVEKPLGITIHEGRRMVEAARRNKRIVQVGLMRRSSTLFPSVASLVQSDGVGKVTVSRAYRVTNMYPTGIGLAPETDAPPDLD